MSDITVKHTYKLKRGEESILEERNPSLLRGEPIVAFDAEGTTKLKIGDGENKYNDLPFIGATDPVTVTLENDECSKSASEIYALWQNYIPVYLEDGIYRYNLIDCNPDVAIFNCWDVSGVPATIYNYTIFVDDSKNATKIDTTIFGD